MDERTIAVMLEDNRNRELLADWVRAHFDGEISESIEDLECVPDLLIIDEGMLRRHHEQIQKWDERHGYVPVVLIRRGNRSEILRKIDAADLVDEEVGIPLDQKSFQKTLDRLLSFHDHSQSIQDRNWRLEQERLLDPLTGLPNGLQMQDQLEELEQERDETEVVGALVFKIGQFAEIRAAMAQEDIQELLRNIKVRLEDRLAREGCPRKWTLARTPDGNFILGGIFPSLEECKGFAHALHAWFERPLGIGDRRQKVAIRIGGAVYPDHADNPDQIINHAELARESITSDDASPVKFYSEQLHEGHRSRRESKRELSRAIEHRNFRVYFQALVDMRRDRIIGAEALARWWNEDGEFVSPGDFIPLAEETGLIVDLGKQVVQRACAEAAEWPWKERSDLILSVNFSAQELQQPLGQRIREMREHPNLEKITLKAEITESALFHDETAAQNALAQLREAGFEVALDDYGTGYASLQYLSDFPINVLKIDQQFVTGMVDSPHQQTIVQSTISMAHDLGLRVIAEGVETSDEYQLLKELGCDHGQGYWMSKPIPPADFLNLLKTGATFAQ